MQVRSRLRNIGPRGGAVWEPYDCVSVCFLHAMWSSSLASSSQDLQCTLRFASIKWLGLKSASSSPRQLFLTGRKWLALSGSVEKPCPRRRGSSILGFISEDNMEDEIDRWVGADSTVMQSLYWYVDSRGFQFTDRSTIPPSTMITSNGY